MTVLTSSAVLSFPVVMYAALRGATMILYPWSAVVLGVLVIGAFMDHRTRGNRFGFWIEVEAFNPTRAILPLLLSTAVAIGMLLVVLAATLEVPLSQLVLAIAPLLAFIPFWFVVMPLANRLRRRWYGRMVLRYVGAPLPTVEAQIRQSLARSGAPFSFDPKGKMGPFRGRTFDVESGTRLMLIRGTRFGETRIFAMVAVPLEAYVASNQERLVEQALRDLEGTPHEDKGL